MIVEDQNPAYADYVANIEAETDEPQINTFQCRPNLLNANAILKSSPENISIQLA